MTDAPDPLRTWIAAARLRTLPAAVVPVAVGTACAAASGGVALGPALAALGGALAIQIGTNFANDVFDAERGADGPDRIGPLRAVAAGLITAGAMKRAMIAAFGVATLLGVYLVAVAGWPVVAIGVASVLSGIAYTGGPWPLGYHGLGDLFVLVFFGLVATCGTVYAQALSVPAPAWIAGAAVGSIATAILVVNNLRDRETDAKVGKNTLAVKIGATASRVQYVALIALSFALAIALGTLWPLLALPAAVPAMRTVFTQDGAGLNRGLGQTARLQILYSLLLAGGLWR